MKASELRIGNYINAISKVTTIEADGCNTIGFNGDESSDCFFNYENIYPIFLTEEWLLKFGFKKGGEWFTKYNYPHQINISIAHSKSTIGAGEEYEVEIKYVHQLQNLYFTLTGEELTIKE